MENEVGDLMGQGEAVPRRATLEHEEIDEDLGQARGDEPVDVVVSVEPG